MSTKSTASKGLGCLTVIGIVFVIFKLLSIQPVASWSWLWVLCPFWIGIAIDVILLFIVVPLLLVVYKILSKL